MKKIFLITLLTFSAFSFAQVAIGKESVTNNSVSLEFATGNKGIILPWVTSEAAVAGVVPGTLIYDVATRKVKVKLSNSWRDLSKRGAEIADLNTSLQDNVIENTNAKTMIGTNAATDTTPGILVLSDADKAMILPSMESPHLTIKNPAAGMMAYDTVKKQLVIFNGSVWTFWKA